jgi:hypothetical protein
MMRNKKLVFIFSSALLFFIGCGGGSGVGTNTKISDEVIYSNDRGIRSLGVAAKPPFFISIEDPAPNEVVTISLDVAVGTIISIETQGSGCGDILSQSGIAPFSISGNAGLDGDCEITATYNDGANIQKKSGRFIVAATNPNLPPVSCNDGIWVMGDLPTASTSLDSDAKRAVGLPTISSINGPREFINGGSSEFTVHSVGGSNISAVLVKVDSYNGYFHIPVYASSHSGQFKFSFASDFFDRVKRTRANEGLHLTVIIIDELNQISESLSMELKANETGFGDVKVSISWDTPTDVDLFITDPNGVMTGYSSQHPGNGSHHDLDSNAGCTIDGKNNENIFWDTGTALPGEYTVTVDMYDNCTENEESDRGASGTLTMVYSGDDSPETISWSLGNSGSKSFKFVHAGAKYKVSGNVTYEDFPVTREGLSKIGRMLPVRYAKVQVIRDDGEILAEGSTDLAGNYAFAFSNDDIVDHPHYLVYIYAQQYSNILKQEVRDKSGDVYVFATNPLVNMVEMPEKKDLNIAIKKADNAAAMNIFDVGVWCNMHARAYGGKVPEELIFTWPVDIDYSYYSKSNFPHISITGIASDPDGYDDLIIGHEYGHFVMDTYSRDNSPGEDHTLDPSIPTLAWSEGWATFFSAMALNKSFFVNTTNEGASTYYSLESLPSDITLGNVGNKLDGDLSEAVVSAVLWDLYDSTDETYDTLNNKSTAIWRVLTTYLNSSDFKDRGKTGVDLVDFLDGWFYLGYGNTGNEEIGMIANVWFLHNLLGYDFKINPK